MFFVVAKRLSFLINRCSNPSVADAVFLTSNYNLSLSPSSLSTPVAADVAFGFVIIV
jgi:hypothetical protein